ncbi:family 10 glycosylhydrolase [Lederbergia sp. NSJ-179]|uniref:glycoside hydrolase family 10 protein n=1 Tax=Lederbergia sp. NSJ-179 TaxID=2931402 RepID=UPI001FD2C155|nr:family 10 glycosylhydrolase [Lederbergia sp. NSJ-179]MCJ7843134.1 family 10 glycosylhydrolase [Lederbergia sp. NSJ-179]
MGIPLVMLFLPTIHPVKSAGPAPKQEMRASWISTVANIDMKPGMTKTKYTAWAKSTIQMLEKKNFNTVIFQVKPTSDALYPSKLAPWSHYITGQKQGTDPGYDPLQIMLDTAHQHGMELHAWMNPYRVTMPSQGLEDLASNHIANQQPDWVVQHGQQYYLDPGIPGVQAYLVETVKELVTNYDVDAVHMDDYFYPGADFADQKTYKQYGSEFANIGDWRRHNVNQLVEDINLNIKAIKPWVQFGISPTGIYRNQTDDPTGSATNGNAHYDSLFADSRQWIQKGSIDYITPQIYWSRPLTVASYTVLLDWWSRQVETQALVHPVHLYIGMADYKVNNNFDTAWDNPRELPEQILENRANGITEGQMHFTLRDILKNRLGYSAIIDEEIYNTKALTPATPWNGAHQPKKPSNVEVDKQGKTVTITIDNKKRTDAKKYVIYRFEGNKTGDYRNPKNIVGVIYDQNGTASFTDRNIDPDKRYTYGVTSVSHTGVESKDAKEKKTKK